MENFPNELDNFDPLKVGMNIRNERKRAGFSIAQLSEDVGISVGKLSYLEKGQLSKGRSSEILSEIKAIADALTISITNILNDEALIKPPIEKYYPDIDLGLQFIVGGLLIEARKLIDRINNQITENEKKWLQPALLFLEAEIFVASGEQETARIYFTKISNLNGHHTLLNQYKVRALNALACDSVSKLRLTEGLLHLKKALIFTEKTISAEQRANTYYNLALLYGFMGYMDVAVMHAKNAETLSYDNTPYLAEIRFALGIFYMMQEETEKAISYISEALSFYQKVKDLISIGNMYKCFYILYRIDPHKYASIRSLFEEDYLSIDTSNTLVKLGYLHTWIELMIEQNQLTHVEKHIDTCIQSKENMPANFNYRTYWIAAEFYKKTGQSDKQLDALVNALQFVDDTMIKERALALYELAVLREPDSKSLFHEVAQLFDTVVEQSELNQSMHQMLILLPKMRY